MAGIDALSLGDRILTIEKVQGQWHCLPFLNNKSLSILSSIVNITRGTSMSNIDERVNGDKGKCALSSHKSNSSLELFD